MSGGLQRPCCDCDAMVDCGYNSLSEGGEQEKKKKAGCKTRKETTENGKKQNK